MTLVSVLALSIALRQTFPRLDPILLEIAKIVEQDRAGDSQGFDGKRCHGDRVSWAGRLAKIDQMATEIECL